MGTASTESTERTFEEVVSRLEDVVERLEGGELPLEESLAIFEEGVKLSREGAERDFGRPEGGELSLFAWVNGAAGGELLVMLCIEISGESLGEEDLTSVRP